MIFCIASDCKVKEVKTLPECDIAVFGFKGLGEVDYESELKGLTDKFEDAARLSKAAKCGVLCGCKTNSRGVLRKSVSVADRGKLLGISDMNHVIDGENYKSGAGLGVYSVGGYKIGLCVENDLLFPDGFKALSLCGCNVIVAFLGNMAFFSESSGEIATSAQPFTLFEVSPQNRYHVITTRTKGMFSDMSEDY